MGSRSKPGRESKKPKKDKKVASIAEIEAYAPDVEVVRKPHKVKETSADEE